MPTLDEKSALSDELNKQLERFIAAHFKRTDHAAVLLRSLSEQSFRILMLIKMSNSEIESHQRSLAKEWLNRQEPDLKERIMNRVEEVELFLQETGLFPIFVKQKSRLVQQPSLAPKTTANMNIKQS